jgi:hypothetical protein
LNKQGKEGGNEQATRFEKLTLNHKKKENIEVKMVYCYSKMKRNGQGHVTGGYDKIRKESWQNT